MLASHDLVIGGPIPGQHAAAGATPRRHIPCRWAVLREVLEARTLTFATDVFSFCQSIAGLAGWRAPAGQLQRCAASVGANYRASSRARSRAEFAAKLAVVVEEADEAVYWFEFLVRIGAGDTVTAGRLAAEAKELRAIFAAACAPARRNRRRSI